MNSVIRRLVPLFILIPLLGAARNGGIGDQDLGVPSTTGLVVSTSAPASDAGAGILQAGGNAVDAAVATAFALAVTHPSAGNIGGGGFMIVRDVSGKAFAFDYREKAPLRSKPDMYLDEHHKINRRLTDEGYLAPGVPGTVRGLELAHKRLGKLAWNTVLSPAVRLAENGFVLSRSRADDLNRQLRGVMGKYPGSVEAYGKPGGAPGLRGIESLLAGVVLYPIGMKSLTRTYPNITVEKVNIPTDADAIARGRHVSVIWACTKCHGEDLSGGLLTNDPIEGTIPTLGVIPAPNLTSGNGGISQSYTEVDWVRTIRHGIKPNNQEVIYMYVSTISDQDLGDLIAYLKQIAPVDTDSPAISYGPILPILPALGIFMPAAEMIDHNALRPEDPVPGATD